MRTKINVFATFITIGLLMNLSSCSDSKKNRSAQKENKEKNIEDINLKRVELYYGSPSHNIKYDHDISGIDEDGKEVKGKINLEDEEIAIGVLDHDNNEKVEIVSEHIDSNRIIATDENGIRYRLKVD